MKMLKHLLVLSLTFMSLLTNAQNIEGVWGSYDDGTGELKSEVELYIKDGKLYGKIIELHNLKIPIEYAKCYDCTDYRKDQPVLGMKIITELEQSGKYWSGVKALLDPNNGKTYDAKLWLVDDNKLAVRGYSGWFYRTQYWRRK